MKTRVVIIQLEMETDATLKMLRDKFAWEYAAGQGVGKHGDQFDVRQVSAAIAQGPKESK